jgi:capsular polysaccharide transport system permease protein
VSLTADAGPDLPGTLQGVRRVIKGFRIQGRVIHALALRELTTRFGRNQMGFVWLVLEPLMLASAIAVFHWLVRRRGAEGYGDIPVFLFYVIGYAPYFAFRAIINRAPSAFHANMTLMYHRQVRLTDVVVARNVLEASAVMAVLVLVIGGSAWLVSLFPDDILLVAAALAMMLLYANGLSMLVAAAAARWEVVDRIVHPLTYLSLPISGAFLPVHHLPESWRDMLLWNPQVNMHEMVREGMFGEMMISHYHVDYTVACVVIVNLLGLAALRAVRPKLEF